MVKALLTSATDLAPPLRSTPPDYTSQWCLPGATQCSHQQWSDGCLHMEGRYCGKQLIQVFTVRVQKRQKIYFTVSCSFTALWYVCTGSSRYLLEGLGNHSIHAGHCVLSFMPKGQECYAWYEPGEHVFMCIGADTHQLKDVYSRLPQLDYFIQQTGHAGVRAIQQPVVAATDVIQRHFELLLQADNRLSAREITAVVTQEYQRLLLQLMQKDCLRDRHIALAVAIKEYVDTSVDLSFCIAAIAMRFDVSEYYAERAFKMLTGQTLGAYLKEQRLLYIHELIVRHGMRVKELGAIVGLSADTIFRIVRERFDQSIKELLRSRSGY